MKNKKGLIFVLIILMSVGFAAVTTTLIINGTTIVAEDEEDYQVYFSGAVVDKEDYTNEIISKDKKTITFETKELMKDEISSELKYDVTNGSTIWWCKVKVKVKVDKMKWNRSNKYIWCRKEIKCQRNKKRNTRNKTKKK